MPLTPPTKPVLKTTITAYPLFAQGKVRDVYDLGDRLLIVTTDRLSAFDVVLPNGVPGRGVILNQISLFWFKLMERVVPNHLITDHVVEALPELAPWAEELEERAVLVHKARRVNAECIVRGYLAGSGWKEYKQSRTIGGIPLPEGLVESARLPQPLFTPSTKAEEGHDENINLEQLAEIVGKDLAVDLERLSLAIYTTAAEYALQRGIIIADTKFEFGWIGDKLCLIDEVLSPDSSRFWWAERYAPGRPQDAYDKQIVRDYLETLDWDKTAPGPELPDTIIQEALHRYSTIYDKLTV